MEETLPVPNIKPETITQTKKKRSANQLAWSRELGKRSQEFKKRKQQYAAGRETAAQPSQARSTSLNHGMPVVHEMTDHDTSCSENSTSLNQSSYYLYYLLPVGILAGVYYFRNDIIMLTRRNSNTTKPENSHRENQHRENSHRENQLRENQLREISHREISHRETPTLRPVTVTSRMKLME